MDGSLENVILARNFQSRSKSRIFLIFGPSGVFSGRSQRLVFTGGSSCKGVRVAVGVSGGGVWGRVQGGGGGGVFLWK